MTRRAAPGLERVPFNVLAPGVASIRATHRVLPRALRVNPVYDQALSRVLAA